MPGKSLETLLSKFSHWAAYQQYLTIGLILFLIGLIDYFSGTELSLSLFYLLPISLAGWTQNRNSGVFTALGSAATLLIADLANKHQFASPLVPFWNMLIRLGVFLIVALLLRALHQSLIRERAQASTDYLTGAANTRSFMMALDQEILRAKRYQHPFTLAYLDLDNFKQVNDEHGHARGDDVLKLIVQTLKGHLRAVDTIARLGGDEFAVLLPETPSQAAEVVLGKINTDILSIMKAERLPVTLSAGIMTYEANYPESNEVIKAADKLMYEVKHASKNAMIFKTVA